MADDTDDGRDDAEVPDECDLIVMVIDDEVIVPRKTFFFGTRHLPAPFRQELYSVCEFGEVYVTIPLPKWVELLKLSRH